MKRIINGKVYDTETAIEVAEASRGCYPQSRDFGDWRETLYQTKNGRFFLYGEGGAMTRWSQDCGNNMTSGSEGILAMDDLEALAWCETNEIDADKLTEFFSAHLKDA